MTRAASAFDGLVACLRGEPPPAADWSGVFRLANRTLLSPAVFAALVSAARLDVLTEEGRAYLGFLHARNEERNRRLRAQLIEAVGALNGADVRPVLLKGAVRLFCDQDDRLGARMTRDLDVAVAARDQAAARECLLGLGYRDVAVGRGMQRPQDVGTLELRPYRAPPIGARLPPGLGTRKLVRRAATHAWIPSSTQRAQHWILHDLIKEGDYWRGRIDLRHLHDLAELARQEGDLDWTGLQDSMPDQACRNALDTQLWTLHVLFGTDIPPEVRGRMIVRLQHWRRIFTARHPVAGAPLRLAGNLAWGMKRVAALGSLAELGTPAVARRALRTVLGGSGVKL